LNLQAAALAAAVLAALFMRSNEPNAIAAYSFKKNATANFHFFELSDGLAMLGCERARMEVERAAALFHMQGPVGTSILLRHH
jgi:hypothetical protein